MSSLKKRFHYLGLADFDYLSARVLILSGIYSTGLAKAAEAFEKLFKLLLILEAKIRRDQALTPGDLKQYGHSLTKLFEAVTSRSSRTFHDGWSVLFRELENAYGRRYPEHWTSVTVRAYIEQIDAAYAYFRGSAVANLTPDERERARRFGADFQAFDQALLVQIATVGGILPVDALRSQNQFVAELDIDWSDAGLQRPELRPERRDV